MTKIPRPPAGLGVPPEAASVGGAGAVSGSGGQREHPPGEATSEVEGVPGASLEMLLHEGAQVADPLKAELGRKSLPSASPSWREPAESSGKAGGFGLSARELSSLEVDPATGQASVALGPRRYRCWQMEGEFFALDDAGPMSAFQRLKKTAKGDPQVSPVVVSYSAEDGALRKGAVGLSRDASHIVTEFGDRRSLQDFHALRARFPALLLKFSEYLSIGFPAAREVVRLFRHEGSPPVIFLSQGDGKSGLRHLLTGADDLGARKDGGNRGHLSDFIRLRRELKLSPDTLRVTESIWHSVLGVSGKTRNANLKHAFEQAGVWGEIEASIVDYLERSVLSGTFVRNDVYGNFSVRNGAFRVYVTDQGYITSAQWRFRPKEITVVAKEKNFGVSKEKIQQIHQRLESLEPIDLQVIGVHRHKEDHLLLRLNLEENDVHYLTWSKTANTYMLVSYNYVRSDFRNPEGLMLQKDASQIETQSPHDRVF